MGGNAFKNTLPNARFPRMTTSLYNGLKARLISRLQELYEHVAVPHETPGKQDHGDIDIIVCQPRIELQHEDVRIALGAVQSISFNTEYMTNFAIPLTEFDNSATINDFYQVDVQVCHNVDEWERAVFFDSYGDMGMILGQMVRSHGLSIGRNGLKLAKPLPTSPPIIFHLTTEYPLILEFLGLHVDEWKQGFSSENEIFTWLASSRFFNPEVILQSQGNTKNRAKEIRPMYQNFLEFAGLHLNAPQHPVAQDALGEALDFFNQRSLYTVLIRIASIKRHVTSSFNGTIIRDWTGLQGMPIRFIMDEVRRRLGGNEFVTMVAGAPLDSLRSEGIDPVHLALKVWENAMADIPTEDIQKLVIEVKEELDVEGKLQYDWRAVKQRKAEEKQSKGTAAST